jgi:hypothetical protein
MKLRSLVIRLIVVWIPVLPPTPLIARAQREASSTENPVHVIAAARRGTEVSAINRESFILVWNSGGMKCTEL